MILDDIVNHMKENPEIVLLVSKDIYKRIKPIDEKNTITFLDKSDYAQKEAERKKRINDCKKD